MRQLLNLKQYTPENAMPNTLYLRDGNGEDWYESQKKFSPNTLKVVYETDGSIRSLAQDISTLWPCDGSLVELDINNVPPDLLDRKLDYYYINGKILEKPLQDIANREAAVIDNIAAQLYNNLSRFDQEYQMREAEAKELKESSYKATPGKYMATYIQASGKSISDACETVLSNAQALRIQKEQLSIERMRKLELFKQTTLQDVKKISLEIISNLKKIASDA
ncbi:hypothetical protein [Chromobacterium sp. ASV23]|uniref:hypothetical protein n=1 Tax=Chromobacterium sp. ASV23 TaxID=2795110 RepID=UPI0018ECDC73|nr:hypothetical protein [Chromobacterium sp. ASV23]